jgi:hypothetical protein
MGNLHSLMDSVEPTTSTEYTMEQHVLQTPGISNVELPKYIAIWRHNQPLDKNLFTACILRTEKIFNPTVNKKIWKFQIINNPLEYLGGILNSGILTYSKHNDSWFNSQKHKILVKKNEKITHTDILYNHAFIMFDGNNTDPIPVCKIKNKHGILPEEFFNLETTSSSYAFTMMFGSALRSCQTDTNSISSTRAVRSNLEDNLRREAMLFAERAAEEFLRELPRPPTPPRRAPTPPRPITPPRISRTITIAPEPPTIKTNTSSSIIPQHIVNQYIEGLVAKKEACPITMNELQKNTTCITPCGHAMTHSSAKHWIQDAHSCPVCRLPVSESQLQVWRL